MEDGPRRAIWNDACYLRLEDVSNSNQLPAVAGRIVRLVQGLIREPCEVSKL